MTKRVLKLTNRNIFARASLVKSFLILPDLHLPYQCERYLKLIIKILKQEKFSGIVQLGDALDFWQLSTYDKDPSRKNTILDDVTEWNKVLSEWCRYLPRGAEIHLLEGNHCYRLQRYISRNARELHEIVKPLPDLLNLKERNASGHVKFKWHPYAKWNSCKIGDCVLMHGFYFNQHVAMTNLSKYKVSTICGHTHRVQYVTDGDHFSATLGHGSNEELTAHQPTPTGWQQSMGVLTVDDNGKSSLEIILVKDGEGVFRGKKIKA